MSDIAAQLHQFIAEETGMSEDEFTNTTLLFTDGYIDSFTMTAVLAYIEESFGIDVPNSAVTVENFDSIERMAAFIAQQKG